MSGIEGKKDNDGPMVSIGMPVYNGEETLRCALDSLLGQSFADFELIISDNASTDGTESICRGYAERDPRIRYVRQSKNVGAGANFWFVLGEARSDYFMWAASDDTRSRDFVEVNIKFLSANPEYVASTSPNGFEGRSLDKDSLVSFALDNDVYGRFDRFLEYCWVSHGIFYSLVRTKVLRDCDIIGGQSFIAADWAIDLYLASRGKIHRTLEGYTIFGIRGISNSAGAYKAFRSSLIEFPLPLYRMTRYVIGLTGSFPFPRRAKIVRTLIRINLSAAYGQFHAALYRYYCAIFKSGADRTKIKSGVP
jgi:glycosyltransferase involved in cell wall biosynthesis